MRGPVFLALLLLIPRLIVGAEPGQASFTIRDKATQAQVPCRIHLSDLSRKPVKPVGLTFPYWKDHFVCDGSATVPLPPGDYHYEIERGPEYAVINGRLAIESGQITAANEILLRITDLTKEGWWSGETHIHRPLSDTPLLMRAEDLHVGVVITWWNDKSSWNQQTIPAKTVTSAEPNRIYDLMGGEDERGGGALLFSGLKQPLPIAGSKRESPSSIKWLHSAKQAGAWIDGEKPFWWDFPVWLSTGELDSVGLANNHMNRGGMYQGGEAWGRPRDRERFPEPFGNALWTQSIYYHALNTGFRIPPSAGSASGVLPNPVGYNRMYAYLDKEFSWENWWSAVRAGRVFVTNGPLLRLTGNQFFPGHVFQADNYLEVTIDGKLDSRDPVETIELVYNGRIEKLPSLPAKVKLPESGWFLVRVLADVKNTFRFASTGPWYVELNGEKETIRRNSCEFFREWTDERIDRLRQTLATEEERREVLPAFESARRFWAERGNHSRKN